MDRWMGKVALVTGASAGIGASICRELVKYEMKVIGCARNVDSIKKLADELSISFKGKLIPFRCDLGNESEILNMFKEIKLRYGRLDICINNAGVCKISPLINGSTDYWEDMLKVNIMALCICTREAIKLMKEKEINDGQIIHLSSIAGHRVVSVSGTSFYSGTKHMVLALAEGLRQELRAEKSRIRVCCISPGLVETEFLGRMVGDAELAKQTYKSRAILQAEDIANSVISVLKMPQHVDVNNIIVQSAEESPFQVK